MLMTGEAMQRVLAESMADVLYLLVMCLSMLMTGEAMQRVLAESMADVLEQVSASCTYTLVLYRAHSDNTSTGNSFHIIILKAPDLMHRGCVWS